MFFRHHHSRPTDNIYIQAGNPGGVQGLDSHSVMIVRFETGNNPGAPLGNGFYLEWAPAGMRDGEWITELMGPYFIAIVLLILSFIHLIYTCCCYGRAGKSSAV
jgi:hypothetical protein